jgi:putative ABC transport system substrate-binding protein
MIKRRRLTLALAAGALSPVTSFAQQQPLQTLTRIGFLPLGSSSSPYDRSLVDAFRQGLNDNGLIENRHVVIDLVWANNEQEYPQVVSEMIGRGCKLLITAGTSASHAAKQRTTTLPVIFITVGDPVGIGLVKNLARPGGNMTGFSDVLLDLSGKFVDLAIQVDKSHETVSYLWHTGWANGKPRFQATESAARRAGVKLRSHGIDAITELNDAMIAMKKAGATTIVVQPSPFTFRYRTRIIDAGMSNHLATIFAWPAAATEGALIAYGPNYAEIYRRSAGYVDKIVKGASPGNLPVEQPTKFEMVINLNTAKTLGIKVPDTILLGANQIIEGSVY